MLNTREAVVGEMCRTFSGRRGRPVRCQSNRVYRPRLAPTPGRAGGGRTPRAYQQQVCGTAG